MNAVHPPPIKNVLLPLFGVEPTILIMMVVVVGDK